MHHSCMNHESCRGRLGAGHASPTHNDNGTTTCGVITESLRAQCPHRFLELISDHSVISVMLICLLVSRHVTCERETVRRRSKRCSKR
jgi:hypothetical protein